MWLTELWPLSFGKPIQLSPSALQLWGLSLYLLSASVVSYYVWRSNISLLKSIRSQLSSGVSGGNWIPSVPFSSSRISCLPTDVRICLGVSTIVICLIAWQVYLVSHAPVYELTQAHDGCCTIVGLSADESQWKMAKNDGTVFWFDWCTGGNEYDPKSLDPDIGMRTVLIKYQDKGCKSIASQELGVIFDHSNRKEKANE